MSGTVLITGARGLVGFELTRNALSSGTNVVAVDRLDEVARRELEGLERDAATGGARLECVDHDLTVAPLPSSMRRPFATLFHLAATVGVARVEADPYGTLHNNLLSTLHVLDLTRELARSEPGACGSFVFASSSEVYAGGVTAGWLPLPTPESVPVVIDDVRLPRWSYAASKVAGESAALAAGADAGFRTVIARLHNVYGPRMGPTHVIPALLQRCLERQDPFDLYGSEQTRSFLHVADAARALELLGAEPQADGVFHVGGREETRVLDLAKLVFETTGHRPTLRPRPAPAGSVDRRVPKTSRLERLGFAPRVELADGLAECWRALTGD